MKKGNCMRCIALTRYRGSEGMEPRYYVLSRMPHIARATMLSVFVEVAAAITIVRFLPVVSRISLVLEDDELSSREESRFLELSLGKYP